MIIRIIIHYRYSNWQRYFITITIYVLTFDFTIEVFLISQSLY